METIFTDQGNPVSHAFYLCFSTVPDQSTKNAKIMRLENLALYTVYISINLLVMSKSNNEKKKCVLFIPEVSVGFMFASVEFSEDKDMARVFIAVAGVFLRPLTIQISTVDGTATGTYTVVFTSCYICNSD